MKRWMEDGISHLGADPVISHNASLLQRNQMYNIPHRLPTTHTYNHLSVVQASSAIDEEND